METLIWPIIHVCILFGFVFWKAKPAVQSFVKGRSSTISEKINESKNAVKEMQRRSGEIEQRAKALPELKDLVFVEWKQREQEQIVRIQQGSLKIREQLKDDAKRNMAALQAGLSREIKIRISKKLVALAEQKITAGLNASSKDAIKQGFLGQIERAS